MRWERPVGDRKASNACLIGRAARCQALRGRARLFLDSLIALGHEQRGFAVLGYAFSEDLPFDGLLGADFLRGRRLVVDCRDGAVRLD
jgi:hypothetical protein